MDFIVWHYGSGLKLYLRRWIFSMAWVVHYFSMPLLLPTLFAPWKRLVVEENTPGFHLDKWFQQITFNLISRCIGAVVRLFLLLVGLLTLLPAFLAGIMGLVAWVMFPPIGFPYYYLSDKQGLRFITHLVSRINASGQDAVKALFDTTPGRFVLAHTNLSVAQLEENAHPSALSRIPDSIGSFREIMQTFLDAGVWEQSLLRKIGASREDLELSGQWWDSVHLSQVDDQEQFHFSRPGIGLELLFGYTPQLNQYVSDLSAPQHFSHRLIGREALVSRIERTLSGGLSVILVGEAGVGKKTIVLEFARRAMAGELGSKMIYKRVVEFDYNFLLSESLDLNQKKAKLSLLLTEAESAGNIILVIKDVHRLTNVSAEGLDFTDLFEHHLETGNLKIIAISSNADYERFLAGNTRIRKFMEPVEAQAPSREQATQILFEFASNLEKQRHIVILTQSLRAIIDGSDKYVTDTPFPEKALELLDHVVTYAEKESLRTITPDHVTTVLSEMTGISLAHLSESQKNLLGRLEEVLHGRLVGQDAAVSLIAKSLRARSVGAKNESRPIGSFLFMGPTGVGKTEAAKTLAQVYYGDDQRIIRFDMAEFAGAEGLSRLIGSSTTGQPGLLTTAIKNHPASLLLLDEIEKAPPEIFNLFLPLLDEGSITDAFGKKIICRHLFVIATSNAGAENIRQLVTGGVKGAQLQKSVLDYVLTNGIFSPEFVNRFDGAVVFEPLTQEQLVEIARLMVGQLIHNLDSKNIKLEVDPQVYEKLAQEGYEPEFGARPMRRIVDITIGDVVGKEILTGKLPEGGSARLVVDASPDGFALQQV